LSLAYESKEKMTMLLNIMHIKVRLDGDWKMQRTKKKTKAMNKFKKTAHLGKNQCGQS